MEPFRIYRQQCAVLLPTAYPLFFMRYLQVPELTEGFATSRKATHERFDLVMDAFMRLEIAELSERLVAVRMRAFVRTFASVLSLVRLSPARCDPHECTVNNEE